MFILKHVPGKVFLYDLFKYANINIDIEQINIIDFLEQLNTTCCDNPLIFRFRDDLEEYLYHLARIFKSDEEFIHEMIRNEEIELYEIDAGNIYYYAVLSCYDPLDIDTIKECLSLQGGEY